MTHQDLGPVLVSTMAGDSREAVASLLCAAKAALGYLTDLAPPVGPAPAAEDAQLAVIRLRLTGAIERIEALPQLYPPR